MKYNRITILSLFSIFLISACSKGTSTGSTVTVGSCSATSFTGTSFQSIGTTSAGNNLMAITVNGSGGSLCGAPSASNNSYVNEPCVSVTLCSISNPSNCQTINNILIDTGSYGLRLFSSAITVPLTPITNGNSTLGECAQFGDGSSQWGPVEYAYIQLGNEPKVAAPILVINPGVNDVNSTGATFTPPSVCQSPQSRPDVSPAGAGYNGILGVGLFAQDCGTSCLTTATNGMYFTCENNNCSCGATADLLAQVTNPVALLPLDNNGVIVQLPSVAAGGVSSVSGTLKLGIDTQANNASTGTTKYKANSSAQFLTKFSAFSSSFLSSFIDSGSSVLFIPSISALTDCGQSHPGYDGLFCPASAQSLSAVNYGSNGTPNGTVNFTIENAFTLYNSSNKNVFSTMGASSGTSNPYFDWGLPFFFGKSVFVGIENKTSSLGTGPYWAY